MTKQITEKKHPLASSVILNVPIFLSNFVNKMRKI